VGGWRKWASGDYRVGGVDLVGERFEGRWVAGDEGDAVTCFGK
jgi:hypothetical protein